MIPDGPTILRIVDVRCPEHGAVRWQVPPDLLGLNIGDARGYVFASAEFLRLGGMDDPVFKCPDCGERMDIATEPFLRENVPQGFTHGTQAH